MKIKITLFVLRKEFSAVADTIAEAYEYVKAIEILSLMKSGDYTGRKSCWFGIEKITE